ncbi:NAD-dependent epimerase/dehydratase family protein [Kitasatospora sp. NPDC058115]|uniref:NAD-dependent epimerase/dehydratase family protein n=1 Tax=Kitasatospora sp. NPDC058115 TaxID=3346347 RepID=UPI0036DA2C78
MNKVLITGGAGFIGSHFARLLLRCDDVAQVTVLDALTSELVLRDGTPGEVYNIGGGTDLSSKELTGILLQIFGADWDQVRYIPDRAANDLRYAMDWSKTAALGYQPGKDLVNGLVETADWYRNNPDRWAPLLRTPTEAPKPFHHPV